MGWTDGLRPLGVAVVALGLALPVALSGADPKVPSAREGFAIWPVDTPREAQRECLDAEPWRHSARQTIERFAREWILVKEPEITHSDTGFSLMGPGIPLEHSGGLREDFGCWYVTHISNRDDFSDPAAFGFAGTGEKQVAYLHVRGSATAVAEGTFVSLGSGEHELQTDNLADHRTSGGLLMTVPAGEGPGHFFVGYADETRGVVDDPQTGAFGPPPEPDEALLVPASSEVRRRLEAASSCPRHSRVRGDVLRRLRTDLYEVKDGPVGGTLKTARRVGKDDVVVEVPDATVRWDVWELGGDCRVVGRVTSGTGRVQKVRVSDEAFFFDIDWKDAHYARFFAEYGNMSGSSSASPVADPVTIPIYSHLKDQPGDGEYRVVFYKDGRIVAVEGGAIPALSDDG